MHAQPLCSCEDSRPFVLGFVSQAQSNWSLDKQKAVWRFLCFLSRFPGGLFYQLNAKVWINLKIQLYLDFLCLLLFSYEGWTIWEFLLKFWWFKLHFTFQWMANPLLPVFFSMLILCKISERCTKLGDGRGTAFSNHAKSFLAPKTRLKFPIFGLLSIL